MTTKQCFKCGIVKNIDEFYKHKQMGDGHLNKCKECTKNDVKLKYLENIEVDGYIEKERQRGRDKYAKFKYKNKIVHNGNKNSKRNLEVMGVDLKGVEVHHWNYNKKLDVFLLHPRAHKLIHKYIEFDKDSNLFKFGELLLDTKERHLWLIKEVFKENNVDYNIGVFDSI